MPIESKKQEMQFKKEFKAKLLKYLEDDAKEHKKSETKLKQAEKDQDKKMQILHKDVKFNGEMSDEHSNMIHKGILDEVEAVKAKPSFAASMGNVFKAWMSVFKGN